MILIRMRTQKISNSMQGTSLTTTTKQQHNNRNMMSPYCLLIAAIVLLSSSSMVSSFSASTARTPKTMSSPVGTPKVIQVRARQRLLFLFSLNVKFHLHSNLLLSISSREEWAFVFHPISWHEKLQKRDSLGSFLELGSASNIDFYSSPDLWSIFCAPLSTR